MNYSMKLLGCMIGLVIANWVIAQQSISVNTTKVLRTSSFSFDKKDSLVIVVAKGTVLNWVSYKKLSRRRSFVEQMDKEFLRDSSLRQKFPYNENQFLGNHILPQEERKLQQGSNHFDNIPSQNISHTNDSTYIVYLTDHLGYDKEEELSKITYYNLRHKHFRRIKYLNRDADYLEPASKYLFIIATSNQDNLKLLDTYDTEVRAGVTTDKTTAMLSSMDSTQIRRLYGLTFAPTIADVKSIYNQKLKLAYDELQSLRNQKEARISTLAYWTSENFFESDIAIAIRNSLKVQQDDNLKTTGISRDSLAQFYALLSNLYNGDLEYYKKICNGELSLGNATFSTQVSDANKNIMASRALINGFIIYAGNFREDVHNNTAESGAVLRFMLRLKYLEDGLNSVNKANNKIDETRKTINGLLDISEINPMVTFNDGGTFTQEILTRGKLSLAPDFGLISYGFLQGAKNNGFTSITPYLGTQVNIRPFDQSVPFGSLPRSRKGLLNPVRFSAMLGLTFISIKEVGKRDNFFSATNLLVGIGYRLSTEVRFVAGSMFFKRFDSNYASSTKRIAATAYAGVSIDLNLKSLFDNILGVFTGK